MMGCLGLISRMRLLFICDTLEGSTRAWASTTRSMLDDHPVLEVTTTAGVFANRALTCTWLSHTHYNVIEVVNNDRKPTIARK